MKMARETDIEMEMAIEMVREMEMRGRWRREMAIEMVREMEITKGD